MQPIECSYGILSTFTTWLHANESIRWFNGRDLHEYWGVSMGKGTWTLQFLYDWIPLGVENNNMMSPTDQSKGCENQSFIDKALNCHWTSQLQNCYMYQYIHFSRTRTSKEKKNKETIKNEKIKRGLTNRNRNGKD